MFKFLLSIALLGGLAYGVHELVYDRDLRQTVMKHGYGWFDELLGVGDRPGTKKAAQSAPETPAKRLKAPATPRQEPLPAPPPAPKVYVDRAPVPSALERVRESDRQWLSKVIAQRTDAPSQKAESKAAAKR